MTAEGAFRSRGGPELFIEISLNKGRPVDVTEVIEALQRFKLDGIDCGGSYKLWSLDRQRSAVR